MEIEPSISITKLEIQIIPTVRDDGIRAFVNWKFETSIGDLIVKGGTIRYKNFNSTNKLSYDGPAIKGKNKYTKVLFIDNKDLYQKLCLASVNKYREVTGEVTAETVTQEEVDEGDIQL